MNQGTKFNLLCRKYCDSRISFKLAYLGKYFNALPLPLPFPLPTVKFDSWLVDGTASFDSWEVEGTGSLEFLDAPLAGFLRIGLLSSSSSSESKRIGPDGWKGQQPLSCRLFLMSSNSIEVRRWGFSGLQISWKIQLEYVCKKRFSSFQRGTVGKVPFLLRKSYFLTYSFL